MVSWLYPCSNSIQPSLSIDRLCVNINRFVLLLIQPYLGLSAIARRSCQNYYRPGVVRGANRGNIKTKLSTTVTPTMYSTPPPPFASVRKSAFVFPSERTSCLNLLSPYFLRHLEIWCLFQRGCAIFWTLVLKLPSGWPGYGGFLEWPLYRGLEGRQITATSLWWIARMTQTPGLLQNKAAAQKEVPSTTFPNYK